MPRPKKPGSGEPKTRSRTGCWPCKKRKIKCGEEKPGCVNCERNNEQCDYSLHLNWEGRRSKRKGDDDAQPCDRVAVNKNQAGLGHERLQSGQGAMTGRELAQHWSRNGMPTPSTLVGVGGGGHLRTFSDGPYSNPDPAGEATAQPEFKPQYSTDHLPALQPRRIGPYPSPTDSGVGSPPMVNTTHTPFSVHHRSPTLPQMLPPHQGLPYVPSTTSSIASTPNQARFTDHRSKRTRHNSSTSTASSGQVFHIYSPPYQAPIVNYNLPSAQPSPQLHPHQAFSPSESSTLVPTTPAASSITSEDSYGTRARPSPSQTDEYRRISIDSLMSATQTDSSGEAAFPGTLNSVTRGLGRTSYGTDYGDPDFDTPKNDDMTVLKRLRPQPPISRCGSHLEATKEDLSNDEQSSEFGFGIDASNDYEDQETYYSKPVTVSVPKFLEPLPLMLQENPMNLLYFHHFLNHTARILVPHDCSENPFKRILPEMAVGDRNLLQLLLAYSACHRARLLNHPEPINRITLYVKGVFLTLKDALSNSNSSISNANLATTIMLASLEIISPNSFGVDVSWQNHLSMARQIILKRQRDNPIKREDKISFFLMRWFAYLDVLGGLSGGKSESPLLHGTYWTTDSTSTDEEHQVDCFLGFTSRCVSILANVATLARTCDQQRIDPVTKTIRPDWRPSPGTVAKAESLKEDLHSARMHPYRGCPHRRSSSQVDTACMAVELATTNDAFHHAGLIHLNRRVLGKHSKDSEVQNSVTEIVAALCRVRKGGAAEACLLFPMFSAGCDAWEERQRKIVLERVHSVERSGMVQVKRARQLIEMVWETGQPWETLVQGEFLG